ncbi:ATP synthase F0 subunit B [Nannocystis punicea]|uniref:ATP synthase subunit b n=1 Tax=Nannocystis punicea TaxID=2995304 RepID=A0ABY7HIT5_9BACT|nr:ATP synthase F0 subunit B [Nannocystis poenicansa]WAS98965.1 ATP synthase F0 subunit B [Nannocystis poenicansa]
MHATLFAAAAAPVVDIDGTIFIQAGIFLLLMAILYPLLFKPWLATQARREQAITGTTAAATDLRARADEEGRRYDTRLAEARARAAGIRSDAVKGSEAERQRQLAEARAAAGSESEAQRERLASEAEAARTTLATRVEELAQDIATKLLGRTV